MQTPDPARRSPQPPQRTAAGETAHPSRLADGHDPAIGWRGRLLIISFWTVFGLIAAASLLLSSLGQQTSAPWELIAFTFLGTYTWALLTLPLFALTRRLSLDSGRRIAHAIVLCMVGLLLAVAVSGVVAVISSYFLEETLQGQLQGREGVWRILRYRFLYDLLASLLVLAAGVARDYFLRYRDRREEASQLKAQLVESRLEILRGQLNPHFLFNTLNALSALVAKDPRGVRRMIAGLSELLRYNLDGAGAAEIPLEQEVNLLRRYLEIMEIRYQGRLEVELHVEPDLLSALVPNLILQPLAENSFKHGLGRAGGYGRISVTAERDGEVVVLAVTDTGPGKGKGGEVDGEFAAGTGFGLRHTRERLEQLYGARGELRLDPTPEGGWRAEVRLPFHTHPGRNSVEGSRRQEVGTHA